MLANLPPIANFQPFDPSKVPSYRARRAMILASIVVKQPKKIKDSVVTKKKKAPTDPLSMLTPAQQAMFALAMKAANK